MRLAGRPDRDAPGHRLALRPGQTDRASRGPVVRNYLSRVTYDNGWTRTIQLPQYKSVDVVVDPWLNGGQPTVADRGIRVNDIVNRLKAREPAKDVAYDYDLTLREVEAIREAA